MFDAVTHLQVDGINRGYIETVQRSSPSIKQLIVTASTCATMLIFCAPRAQGEECRMTATVHGADTIANAIRDCLNGRGVITDAPDGCPSVDVTVRKSAGGIQIAFTDDAGRTEQRTASDIDSAVNLIDAWVQEGLADHDPLAPPSDASDSASAIPSASIAAIGAAATFGASFDGGLLFGGRLQVPLSLGPVQLGLAVSLQDDPHLTGASKETSTNRLMTDIAAFIQYPLRVNRLRLRFGIDIGLAVIAANTAASGDIYLRAEEDDEAEEEEEDDDGTSTSLGSHYSTTAVVHAEYRETTFLLGARVDLLVPLKNRNAVWIGLFLSTYPAADHERRIDSSTETDLPQAGTPIGIVMLAAGLEFPQ